MIRAEQTKLKQGELQLDLTLQRGSLLVTKSYVVYPGSSVIRQWVTFTNAGDRPLKIVEPGFLSETVRPGDPEKLDFHWMTGGENQPGSWMLKTEKLGADKAAALSIPTSLFPAAEEATPLSVSAWARRPTPPGMPCWPGTPREGVVIGWDYFGHWASSFRLDADGAVTVQLKVAGHKQTLAPGESLTTPKAFVGLFRDDLDEAGNEVLDWQYRYLWDYTRDGWFPAIRMLGYWMNGTGWGQPGVGWTGGKPGPGRAPSARSSAWPT